MAVHDWSRVKAGAFHDFHCSWITHIKETLNNHVLPSGYFAVTEQRTAPWVADIVTLEDFHDRTNGPALANGNLATLAAGPPKTLRHVSIPRDLAPRARTRRVAVRTSDGERLVAVIEVVPSSNKDRPSSVAVFVDKVNDFLDQEVHVLILDMFRPGKYDPEGLYNLILTSNGTVAVEAPAIDVMTFASISAGDDIDVYLEHLSVGDRLPDMPLFLKPKEYVTLPLETTYQVTWAGFPSKWKRLLESGTE